MFNQEKKITRLGWSIEEQQFLKDLYEVQGIKSWKLISEHMCSFKESIKRTPKQCRERYTNHVKFDDQKMDKATWSSHQDELLFQKYMQVGSRWVQISKFLPNRSQNQIKNRFYGACRKLIRKINLILSETKKRQKNRKPIKQSSIFKLLETNNVDQNPQKLHSQQREQNHNFIQNLKFQCLRIASRLSTQINHSQICEIAEKIHIFNVMTRFKGMRKARQSYSAKRKRFPPLIQPQMGSVEVSFSNCEDKKSFATYTSCHGSKQIQQKKEETLIQTVQNSSNISSQFVDVEQMPEKEKHVVDLDYELSLILGIQYEPPNLFIF